VPVAAVPRALAGHGIDAVELAARDDDPSALAAAIERVVALEGARLRARGESGRAHLARHHSAAAFRAAFAAFAAAARDERRPPVRGGSESG